MAVPTEPEAPIGRGPLEVILTGTGVPHPRPNRAGAGVLVRWGDVALQFDAGRSTVMRLMEADTPPSALSALMLTHVHSDHVVGLADVTLTRWIQQQLSPTGPLMIVAPEGAPSRFVERMLDAYDEDIDVRRAHVGAGPVGVDLRPFAMPDHADGPVEVWRSGDGSVRVSAAAVHHEPVAEAVAYRVDTPSGSVVISGDTRVCDEVEALSIGADLVVHEACRTTALAPAITGTVFERIFSYHADTVALGAMAARAGIERLVLTHLIPPPDHPGDEQGFIDDLRQGGYQGEATVGEDLMRFVLNRPME